MDSYLAHAAWRRSVSFGIGFAGVIWALVELARLKGDANVDEYPYSALLAASIVYLVVFGVLEYIGGHGPDNRKQYGWVALLLGADGRLSTSKTQAVLWTVVLATVIVFLGGIVAFGPGSGPDLFNDTKWEQYLVLLGGPFAAGVLAKFTTVSKIQSGSISKSLTGAASSGALGNQASAVVDRTAAVTRSAETAVDTMPKAADAATNDDGEIDIPDTQYLIFNLVAIVYFLLVYFGQVFGSTTGLDRFVLPDIPSVLLGLTGASAATYVGFKTAQRDAPKIVSMSPQPAATGQLVNVVGTNLMPTGETPESAAARTSILLQSLAEHDVANATMLAPAPTPRMTASSLSFTVPTQFANRVVAVRIVTAGSVTTDPLEITVGA